jgi:uncharacterized protein
MLSRALFLHSRGYSVLLIDFQAHGESPGRQITFGDRESRDVVAALQFLHRTSPIEKVGVIGVSLGAAALVLADDRPSVDAVVMESMYPTLQQALTDRLRLHVGALGPMLAPLLRLQLRPRLGVTADRLWPIDRMAANRRAGAHPERHPRCAYLDSRRRTRCSRPLRARKNSGPCRERRA